MTPDDLDRVFGRGRLGMITGDHVQVYREASRAGERRRYTKRFLATESGDYRPWTEREWRILARLVGHGVAFVPEIARFDRGDSGEPAVVQTYDAGITVDHWATLLPVQRDGRTLSSVFEDCAHWWALARHALVALDAIHELCLVHLDLKPDNICIPAWPPDFDPHAREQTLHPRFEQLTLIDFAFSLVHGERLTTPLPLAEQPDYDYQSPRLLQALEAAREGDLQPTRDLDWRCDLYSLAAMLRRFLPDPELPFQHRWTAPRHSRARALVRRLIEIHDAEVMTHRPHAELIALASRMLDDEQLAESLQRGWKLRRDVATEDRAGAATRTPITRIVGAAAIAPEMNVRRWMSSRQPWRLWPGALSHAFVGAVLAAAVTPLGESGMRPHPLLASASNSTKAAAAVPGSAASSGGELVAAASAAAGTASAPEPRGASMAKVEVARPSTQAVTNAASAATPRVVAQPRIATANANPGRKTNLASAAHGATDARDAASRRSSAASQPPRGSRSATGLIAAAPNTRASVGPKPAAKSQGGDRRDVPVQIATKPLAARNTAAPAPLAAPSSAPSPSTSEIVAAAPATDAKPETTDPDSRPADLASRAGSLIANEIPRVSEHAERLVLRVLFAASQGSQNDDEVKRAASAIQQSGDASMRAIAPQYARYLNDAAQDAWRHSDFDNALTLATRAFGANPADAEIAGTLAFLNLKHSPPQADLARRLAMYALVTRSARYPYGRIDDWTTFAIASALSGRERDARNAWFVMLALAPDVQRLCRAAVNAYARHGERIRATVEPMLYRVHTSGRQERSAFCEWPPHWAADASTR